MILSRSLGKPRIGTSTSATGSCFGFESLFSVGRNNIGLRERMVLDHRNLLGDELLNITKVCDIVVVAEGYRHPSGSCSSRSSDTMHVGLRDIRDVIVDHVLQGVNINPTGGDIGRDQHPGSLLLEIGQGSLPVVLGLVSMDCFRDDSSSDEELHNFVRSVFGSSKNEHIPDFRILQ